MRYCKNCGKPNDERYTYCSSCGNRLVFESSHSQKAEDGENAADKDEREEGASPLSGENSRSEEASAGAAGHQPDDEASIAPDAEAEEIPADEATAPAASPAEGQNFSQAPAINPVIAAIRKAGTSKLFLAATVFFTLFLVLTILEGAIPKTITLSADVENLLESIGSKYEIDLLDMVQSGELLPNSAQIAFANLLNIITVIGLWMFYFAARRPGVFSVKGLQVIKVVNVIKTVLLCLLFVLLEILLMIAIASLPFVLKLIEQYNIDTLLRLSGYDIDFSFILMAILIFMIVVIAVYFILTLIYLLFIIGTINTVKSSITYGVPADKVSVYVVVINFITAANYVGLTSLTSLMQGSVISTLASVAFGVFLILISICMLSYRKTMKQMILMNRFGMPHPSQP